MKYIKLYDNRHDFVFDEQRYFPNTALVNGEDEPTYFTDVEEVVFELTVSLPTEKVVTGQTYTLAVEYGGADVFEDSTVTTTGDVTLNGTQFTANTDGDFSVTATYGDKTVTLNGTSKLMTAAPRIEIGGGNTQYGRFTINVIGQGTKTMTFNGEEYTSNEVTFSKIYYEDLTEQTVVASATAQENGKWESDTVTKTFVVPVAAPLTATISDDTLEDGQTAQITVMYGSYDVTNIPYERTRYTASGDVTCTEEGVVTAAYSTGSGSIVVNYNNLPPITINVTVTEAVPKNIVFADPDVKAILVNKFGSDGEITEEQAAAVTTWFSGTDSKTNRFFNNQRVNTFDEFSYFTGISEIGSNAFQQCLNMTSITLPSNITRIDDSAFNSCYKLASVTIPAGVTYIGNRAFLSCSALESVNIPAGVTSISNQAFTGCRSLESVTIPENVTSIGNEAFGGCFSLGSITIPAAVTSIGDGAFKNCNFESITIPASVTSIGNGVFSGCENLAYISVDANNPFYSDRNGSNAIYDANGHVLCGGGACTEIDDSLMPFQIDDYAFSGRNFVNDTLTIPSCIMTIGNYAFNGISGLKNLVVEAEETVPTLGSDNSFENLTIYVPSASLDAYKSATNWSDFADRIRAFGVYVSLSAERIVTGETYTLSVKYNGRDVLSNATITSTGNITISGSSFTANSDGAFSITATYNGYTATLNGTASQAEPTPEYVTAVLDCSQLEDANPLEFCANYDTEAEVPEGLNTLDCSFDGEVSYVENGVITIPSDGNFVAFEVDADYERGGIVYVKLTHPSAEYKFNADTTVLNTDFFTCDVSFNSTTLTTTIDNIVQLDNIVFDGSNFDLVNGGSTDIKITRIEVGYVPAS